MKSIIILAALFVVAHSAEKTDGSEAKVQVIQIDKFRQANANVTELEISRNARLNQNWYTVGRRQNNDRLVAMNSGWAQYPSKDNLELTITYPVNGPGAIVTYMAIVIYQDDGTYGRGYIVSGGVGYRNIKVIVEAWNTAYIKYDYQIYGI